MLCWGLLGLLLGHNLLLLRHCLLPHKHRHNLLGLLLGLLGFVARLLLLNK